MRHERNDVRRLLVSHERRHALTVLRPDVRIGIKNQLPPVAMSLPLCNNFNVNASLNRDYTMVVGLVVLYATLLVVLNLVVDLAYLLLDPRVKYD